MDYQSLLKKDYKNVSLVVDKWSKPNRPIIKIVLLVSVATLMTAGLVSFFNSTTTIPLSDSDKKITVKQQITYPLQLNSIDKINAKAQQHSKSIDQKTVLVPQPTNSSSKTSSILKDPSWIIVTIKSGDSLARIFKHYNLDSSALHKIISLGKITHSLKHIKVGQQLKIRKSDQGQLHELIYIKDKQNSLHIKKQNSGYLAFPIQKTFDSQISHASVTISNSLFESGIAAGLSETLIMSVANIFGWDIDFALDIRNGDSFNIVYQEHYLDGEKIRDGAILVAEFINQKRHFQAVRYTDKKNRTDYYTPKGRSMRKEFLRTPVDFKRISSRFGKRRHPVLNKMRLHKGVDYATSRGTPVRASGDGKVIYKRRKGAYGRTVIIKHGGKYSTLYAHLQAYKKGLYVGKKIKQGQIIAYVGSSGRTTGPHLHYEFRVNGRHTNPLTIKLPKAKPINKKYKKDYLNYAKKMMVQLENYNPVNVALK